MTITRKAGCVLPLIGLLVLVADARVGLESARPLTYQLKISGTLPLVFEANQGQMDSTVDFLARGSGHEILLSATEITLPVNSTGSAKPLRRTASGAPVSLAHFAPNAEPEYSAVRVRLIGANPHAAPTTFQSLTGTVNYLLGNDPTKWRRNIETYSKVGYRNLYPGIDLVYYGNQRRLEFDFVVAPGSDPNAIALEFEGVSDINLDPNGALVLITAGPALHLHKPLVYQDIGGKRQEIPARYVLSEGRVGFQVGRYDTTEPLVIDPVLAYATRLGGSGDDAGYAIAVDAAGNAYVTGETSSIDFPRGKSIARTRAGSTNVFVAKLNVDASRLIYVTYLGGTDADVGYGIAVDAAGNAYITGDTRSSDFPVANPLQPKLAGAADVFVAKLSADGSQLVYSTYFGGSGGERGLGIAVDGVGNALVTGYTNSTDFPATNALQPAFAGGNADAFVLKLNANGTAAVYSTYLGGGNDRPDIGTAIAADAAGNAYVTGFTNSPEFPTANPLQKFVGPTDVFVTKLDPNGRLVYSTHLGGSADDEAMGIAVDAGGSAYVTGHTESPNFPTTPGAFRPRCVAIDASLPIGDICLGGDAFVAKLNPDGSALVYATYLSGRRFEVGRSIAVDAGGNAYVTGLTSSPDFPRANSLQKDYGGGDFDAFVVKINPAGSALIYSTYLGGSSEDAAYGIAVDASGHAYVTGYTRSPDFPTKGPLFIPAGSASRGSRDAFIVKITDSAPSQ